MSSSSTPGCFALWCLHLEIRRQPLVMIILPLDYFLPLRSQHRGNIEDIGQSCSLPLSSTTFQTHDNSIRRSQDVTYPSNESLLLGCFRSNSAETKPLDDEALHSLKISNVFVNLSVLCCSFRAIWENFYNWLI